MEPFSQDVLEIVEKLYQQNNTHSRLLARQLLLDATPASFFVENFLEDNEGGMQKLDGFPMLRQVYDGLPQRMLLKCSRKTLKSTLLSNVICLNMIRWNKYKMLYVGPQETSVSYFSSNYLPPRFNSPKVRRLIPSGFAKNDVFEKIVEETGSALLLRYVKEDASRVRGPAVDSVTVDECQDVDIDALPIIMETMAMSPFKREMYAGTPLTTDNTIQQLWKESNQLEWAMKCTHCNHWNTLTEDNEPVSMIRPEGLSCSKCSGLISSRVGEWVSFNPANQKMTGFHLAQPILPHYNEDKREWDVIYNKITDPNNTIGKVYNELFGLSYDLGERLLTEGDLQKVAVLGKTYGHKNSLDIYERNKHKYQFVVSGTDWGVNQITSRTVNVTAGWRDDGVLEVFYAKRFTGPDYRNHIKEIAEVATMTKAFVAADSGPSPDRGEQLIEQVGIRRGQLVRYEHGKTIQRYSAPSDASGWKENRWVLHRTDTLQIVFKMLKEGKILFPNWDEISDVAQDILNVYVEVKQGLYREELFFRHKPDSPDDFLHAINFALMQALTRVNDPRMFGRSSSSTSYDD